MKKFLVILFLAFVGSVNAQQKANYALAERFRELTTMPIVKYSLDVHPRYINNTDRFWYSFWTEEGNKYYLVDPENVRRDYFLTMLSYWRRLVKLLVGLMIRSY